MRRQGLVYALDVGMFFDADADGTGDFRGAMQKLDYLDELGVQTIWLLPYFPTTGDNGYAVDDYYQVNRNVGNLQEVQRFIEECEQHGIDVVNDLVINHTSNRHPWFLASRNQQGTRYDDYYVWRTQKPSRLLHDSMFPGQSDKVWQFSKRARKFYYCPYYTFEPALDNANEDVQDEIKNIIEYWLSFGIHGFRIDSVSHMVERKGRDGPNASKDIFNEMLAHARRVNPDATFIGEADVYVEQYGDFYDDGDRIPYLLSFHFSRYAFLALAEEDATPLVEALNELYSYVPAHAMVNFLRNIDELNIEKLTTREQEIVFDAFASEPDMQIFGRGIRRRLAPMLDDWKRIKMAFNLLFAAPGIPMIPYGDEVGLGEDLALDGRSSVRTPMPWNDSRHAGFTTSADPERHPVKEGTYGYENTNVAAQQDDPDSLLNECKTLARLRQEYDPLSYREHELSADGPVMTVTYTDSDRTLTIYINLADEERGIDGPDKELEEIHADSDYADREWIAGYGYRWFTDARE